MDEDPQLPFEVVSEPDVEGECREWSELPWRVADPQRLLAPPGIREDYNPHTNHGDQPNRKCLFNINRRDADHAAALQCVWHAK